MPFTFSHPAAVLPLALLPARWISITGLVIGSTAPDFEYFFRLNIYSAFSHSKLGILWFDLPLTILLAFVFHLLVRDRLVENLPGFLARRFVVFKKFNWTAYFKTNFIVVVISAIIGICSHILWDHFTHPEGYFVEQISVLKASYSIAGYATHGYNIAQHLSTLIGGLIILFVVLKLPADKNYKNKKSIFPFWVLAVGIALLVLAVRFLTGLQFEEYGRVIITAISGGLAGLILTSILFSFKEISI